VFNPFLVSPPPPLRPPLMVTRPVATVLIVSRLPALSTGPRARNWYKVQVHVCAVPSLMAWKMVWLLSSLSVIRPPRW